MALVWQAPQLQVPAFDQWWPGLVFTFEQAVLSSAFSLIFGFLGGLGLAGRRRWRRPLEALLLLPSLVPTLLILVGVLQSFSFVGSFPFGLWGVVLVHVVLNIGLVSVAVGRLIEHRLAPCEALAYIEGASFFLFLKAGLKLLWRELLLLKLFVFSACVSSFAVVLVASGGLKYTLELLIFYKLKQNLLGEALAVGFLQILLLAVVAVALSSHKITPYRQHNTTLNLLYKPWLVWLPLMSPACLLMGLLGAGLYSGAQQILHNPYFLQSLAGASLYSLYIGGLTGLFVILLFVLLMGALCSSKGMPLNNLQKNSYQGVRKFLLAYSMPSSVLMGFGFLLLFNEAMWLVALGLTLSFFPFIYRLAGDSALIKLRPEVQVAHIMGASRWQIGTQILAPQLCDAICFCAGLAAFWALGDFAFSSIVLGEPKTLALVTYDLLRSYHLNMAVVLVWCLGGLGLILWFLFLGCGHVYKKLLFKIQ